jgi:aldehyde dehydrogenase (NAD+)
MMSIIAGNAVVLKPSDLAPLCALRMVEALDEAGVTKGAINLVTGPGSKVGAEIVENPAVRAISFTGSEATGSGIAIEAAKRRARVQLEMGGKNPTIVLADAQIPDAVNVVVNAAFFSTGQRCTATSRVIVEEPIVERFTAALVERTRALKVGNGLEAGIEIGPSIDDKQLATVLDYVGVGQTEGARVACGGARLSGARGYFRRRPCSRMSRRRCAWQGDLRPCAGGPARALLDHAVGSPTASATGCRRASAPATAYEFINRIEAGLVMVNLPSAGVEYHVPFGGSKQSSLGMREQGPVAVDFYSEIQTAYLQY